MTLGDKTGGHAAEPGSFRDRENQIFYHDGKVYRALSENALQNWERLAATEFFRRRSDAGDLVQTRQVAPPTGTSQLMLQECLGYLSHKRVPFVSYPYEWSFSMMKDAALLQLDLLLDALDEDMTLKDASSYNVQWEGARPFFIDIPSFVILDPGEPWVGYHQFCRLFLYPLLLQAYRNLEFQGWLRGGIDGISPEQCANIFTLKDIFRSGVLKDVFLHAKLQRRYAAGSANVKTSIKSAGFNKLLIQANAKRLRKIVAGLSWRGSGTHWKDYNNENSYLAADVVKKEAFVKEVVHSRRWQLVWDLGCNTGKYSKIAAVNADYVVAVDSDQTVGDHGVTPVFFVSYSGSLQGARLLVGLGAKLNAVFSQPPTNELITPLEMALSLGHLELGRFYLSKGARMFDPSGKAAGGIMYGTVRLNNEGVGALTIG